MFYVLPSLRIVFNSGKMTEYFVYSNESYLECKDWVINQKMLLR